MSVRPLITVCGTTGVGKSNFAIELALHLSRATRKDNWHGARIINADSMQVYRGMDVITNKVPEADRQGIEHLLMGFKSPGEQYVVGQWVQDALKEIDDTHARNEIPIVVGGTSYWIQHLLFPNRLSTDTSTQGSPSTQSPVMSEEFASIVCSLPPDLLTLFNNLPEHPPSALADPDVAYKLHALLSVFDPLVANRWHWKDTRKVLRSLDIIKETSRRPSEIMHEQTKDTSTSRPRFRTLCFWLYAEQSELEYRLNERVDKMIEQGLLSEVCTLRQIASSVNNPPSGVKTDYTLGIYQSIGYKEFHDYFSAPEPPDKAFNAAVERMKLSTRQYAKRQISWIRNKLLPAVYAANAEEVLVPTYLLDATSLEDSWNKNVRDIGIQLMEKFLDRKNLPDPLSLSDNAKKMMSNEGKAADPMSVLKARQKRICEACTIHPDRPFMVEGGQEWIAHCKTRVHRRLANKGKQGSSWQRRKEEDNKEDKEETSSDASDVESSQLFT